MKYFHKKDPRKKTFFLYVATLFRFVACFAFVGILNSRPSGSREILLSVSEFSFFIGNFPMGTFLVGIFLVGNFPMGTFPVGVFLATHKTYWINQMFDNAGRGDRGANCKLNLNFKREPSAIQCTIFLICCKLFIYIYIIIYINGSMIYPHIKDPHEKIPHKKIARTKILHMENSPHRKFLKPKIPLSEPNLT